jgi:hypothetical protein
MHCPLRAGATRRSRSVRVANVWAVRPGGGTTEEAFWGGWLHTGRATFSELAAKSVATTLECANDDIERERRPEGARRL